MSVDSALERVAERLAHSDRSWHGVNDEAGYWVHPTTFVELLIDALSSEELVLVSADRRVYVVMLEQHFANPVHFRPVAVTADADLAEQIAARDSSYSVWDDVPFC